MNNSIDILKNCPLFKNFSEDEITHIIKCFGINSEMYQAKSTIINFNEQVDNVYIVISGLVDVVKDSFNGDRHLLMVMKSADIFAEGVVCTQKRVSPVTVIANTDVYMMKIPYKKIIQMCTNSCSFHSKLIYNMMMLLGEKNFVLNNKVNLLLLHGIRDKIIYYLLEQCQIYNSHKFTIPLNHTQLAEYLNVSRPSMSRELGKLKKDGFIDYYKNTFYILKYNRLCSML